MIMKEGVTLIKKEKTKEALDNLQEEHNYLTERVKSIKQEDVYKKFDISKRINIFNSGIWTGSGESLKRTYHKLKTLYECNDLLNPLFIHEVKSYFDRNHKTNEYKEKSLAFMKKYGMFNKKLPILLEEEVNYIVSYIFVSLEVENFKNRPIIIDLNRFYGRIEKKFVCDLLAYLIRDFKELKFIVIDSDDIGLNRFGFLIIIEGLNKENIWLYTTYLDDKCDLMLQRHLYDREGVFEKDKSYNNVDSWDKHCKDEEELFEMLYKSSK